MKVIKNREYCVSSVDVRGINANEMETMVKLNEKIIDVLASHATDSKKYVSDEDLKLMSAILSVFTEDFKIEMKNSFFDYLEKQKKVDAQPAQPELPLQNDDDEE